MKKFVLYVLLLLTGLINSVVAQNKISGGSGYLMVGYAGTNMTELNTLLSNNGYPALGQSSLAMGGGGHFIWHNFIIGGEGGGTFGNQAENNNYRLQSSYGYGVLNLGYVVAKGQQFIAYPLVGIGSGGMSLLITDKTGLPGSFSDLLNDPTHQSSLSNGGMLLNFSIGADWFPFKSTDGAPVGWLIGLKAGYLLSLNQDNWQIDGQALSGAPASGMSGFYVRLTIGGGGFTAH